MLLAQKSLCITANPRINRKSISVDEVFQRHLKHKQFFITMLDHIQPNEVVDKERSEKGLSQHTKYK